MSFRAILQMTEEGDFLFIRTFQNISEKNLNRSENGIYFYRTPFFGQLFKTTGKTKNIGEI